MILDQHFDRIVILSLPGAEDRANRAKLELEIKGLSGSAQIVRAINGRICEPPAWWPSGNGAWGCMQSHYRVVQDALLDGVERLLVIEDDCIWQNDAARLCEAFLDQLPGDWGQAYFGGQHRASKRPQQIEGRPAVMRAKSIHRTHAYAITRATMPRFLQHIIHAPDYIEAKEKTGHKRHVDHQLEAAQQRGDWPVYCPSFWIAGQGENLSSINGRQQPEQWWHLSLNEAHRRLPVIICDREPTVDEMKALHFGKHIDPENPACDIGVMGCADAAELIRTMELVAHEAFGAQRLPAIAFDADKAGWLRSKWLGNVIELSSNPDLVALRDFPRSKLFRHPWINPAAAPTDETESTSASEQASRRPMVHQVWIGDAELPPRLAGYCDTIRRAFPEWEYRLWREEDMEALAVNAVLPDVVRGIDNFNVGLRSDVVRLEILRQFGGVYFDTDFEALREDLRPLFEGRSGFLYGDEKSGRPSNAMMATAAPSNTFVELYLQRISAALKPMKSKWETVGISGPGQLAECLNFWVSDWSSNNPVEIEGHCVGSVYARGSIVGLWQEVAFPYWYEDATWATFSPANHPQAWVAHHWEGSWNRE